MDPSKKNKLGVVSGVYIPVCLNILSILMFLRFGLILGNIGLLGMLGLLIISYLIDFITVLSLSAVASNGEVKGGGAYYLISRSLGPEFGGSIGLLFYLSQVLNAALNIVGLIDCLKLKLGDSVPTGYWWGYFFETGALIFCTALCFAGSGLFAKASNALLIILLLAVFSITFSAIFVRPFEDPELGVTFTGFSLATLRSNLFPHVFGSWHKVIGLFRANFGILFPATSGIFAGASMSGDLRNPSKAIPSGTLWATFSTFILYVLVILSMASSITQPSLLQDPSIITDTSIWSPVILAGECAVTFFSALMGLIGAAKLLQALGRDKLISSLDIFGWGTKKGDEPVFAILLTYALAQFALLANLNQIATLISMGYQLTFFAMNVACFLLKIGSAPNFRPAFKFFTWQSAFLGFALATLAMFFIDVTYAMCAICLLIVLLATIHYLSPPKHWGDVSQNLIYHQVRKYLLRLKPEHIKFWRPQIILLVNDPRRQTRLIQFCNSMKKGSLYILGHVIVTSDFNTGVHEAKLQQSAWTKYITEASKIKAFVQLTMSPAITWGVRNLILSSGLGGMRPNIAILGFYNMEELRESRPHVNVPEAPISPMSSRKVSTAPPTNNVVRRRRGDTSARLLEGVLPTDVIRKELSISPTDYMTILEDLALRYRLNVAVGKGFETLETPRKDGAHFKKYIDLWPIQMSAELEKDGKSVLTTNFDTYTLILQLGYILHTVPAWMKAYRLRVMVFVEYETELEEERGRVKALLEKLRIEAEVHAFWLASGDHMTYEFIINGRSEDYSTETMVNEVLKNEYWWEELRNFRGRLPSIDGSVDTMHLDEVLASSLRRPGFHQAYTDQDGLRGRRRPSMTLQEDLPKNPTVSSLARLGVSMGIHTQNLPQKVFDLGPDGDSSEDGEYDDGDIGDGDSDADFNELDSAASEADIEELHQDRAPLLAVPARRKSQSDAALRRPVHPPKKKSDEGRKLLVLPENRSYGTIASAATTLRGDETPVSQKAPPPGDSAKKSGTRSAPLLTPVVTETQDSRPSSRSSEHAPPSSSGRPGLTRTMSASMRFSSALVPQTQITSTEDSGPSIAFVETEVDASSRPALSRTVSLNQVASRQSAASNSIPRPTTGDDAGRRVSFAEQTTTHKLPRIGEDAHINIPDLLLNYRMGRSEDDNDSRASFCTQDIPLSFNDLPSRAQHLILNDLMRQNSQDTAVLFTTLPIPEEGTCRDEEASVQYLSDVEVLCHDLPPTLMVLSNTMTVTVSL